MRRGGGIEGTGQVGRPRGSPRSPLRSIWKHIPLLHTENIYPFIPKTLIKCQLCAGQELRRGDTTVNVSGDWKGLYLHSRLQLSGGGTDRKQLKNTQGGISLVVEWVRLCAPNAGGPGSIPGQGTRSCRHAAPKSTCHNQDPMCCN